MTGAKIKFRAGFEPADARKNRFKFIHYTIGFTKYFVNGVYMHFWTPRQPRNRVDGPLGGGAAGLIWRCNFIGRILYFAYIKYSCLFNFS